MIDEKGEVYSLIPTIDIYDFVVIQLFGPRIQKLMERKRRKLPVSVKALLPLSFHQIAFKKTVYNGDDIPKLLGSLSLKVFNRGSRAEITSLKVSREKNCVTKLQFYYKVVNPKGRRQWPVIEVAFQSEERTEVSLGSVSEKQSSTSGNFVKFCSIQLANTMLDKL